MHAQGRGSFPQQRGLQLLAGLGHVCLLLMWLEAPELTAVHMVPSGSHEIYEKCYPIKEGAGWLCAFTSAFFGGEVIVSASGKCLTESLSTNVAGVRNNRVAIRIQA